jgi:NADH-quinone oxidoreductase subunit J
METGLFYIFSALALLCGLLVVANPFSRNPVASAMFLALTILSLAGLFVLLRAFFLAAVQILIYAGAVIVLFLFVIMLFDLREGERRKTEWFGVAAVMAVVGMVASLMVGTLLGTPLSSHYSSPTVEGVTAPLGRALFTKFVLPFEIISVLLLVAMIGVVVLSKKELK